ncbi:MAG: alanine racemase [Polyangiaceae bacterium]
MHLTTPSLTSPDQPPSSPLSRRLWLSGAAALFATSCVPDSHVPGPSEESALGAAASADSPASMPSAGQFAAWNAELRDKAPGRDAVLLDLDAVDHNIAVVTALLGSQLSLRIVTKSLPSLDLIEYVAQQAGTNKLMAFSEGILFGLLDRFGANADILLGRPMPAPGARRLLKAHPLPARGVKWLIDTKERLLEYLDLATSIHHRLSVAIEIDVGLHRGGARTTTELLEMLAVIADNPSRLRFVGFMGYEGHVPFAPPGFDSDAEFAAVQARYADFVQAGSQAYPALFEGPLVLNSGGSATHYRYGEDLSTVVNDIALGNAFLLPGRFADLGALGFVPALFAASPVLKKVDPAEVPFAPGYLPALAQDNPSLEVSYFMLAGGFPGDVVHPEGLIPSPFIPGGEGVENLLPNQTLRNGARDVGLGIGDFVFYYPWEGDALVWLQAAEVMRDGEIVVRFPTMREGCSKGCGAPLAH